MSGVPETPKPPPHNLEAEQALLGAILVENEAMNRVSGFLKSDHFYDPLHGRIYETLATLIHTGKRATPVTVKTFFQNAEPINPEMTVPQYLGRLAANATTIINAATYGRTIYDFATRRSLVLIGDTISERAYDCGVGQDPAALIALAANDISNIEAQERALHPRSLLTYADNIALPNSSRYLIKHLLGTASVAALYGPSCAGKTFYALKIAFHIALGLPFNGRRVAHFRTWHGTVLAALALQEFEKFDSQAGAKRNIRDAIQKVAARLGNTPTICRKCYIHPEIITTYIEGSLLLELKHKVEEELREDLAALRPEEAAVLTLLRNRLSLTLKDKLQASLKVD